MDLRAVLDGLSRAWREQRFDDLAGYFAEDIVMKGPDLKELGRGRDVAVGSYRTFMESSVVHEYEESGHAVEEWGDTAVATYDWKMTYEQKGKTSTESGHDLFVFVR